jgi:hypothetical protein
MAVTAQRELANQMIRQLRVLDPSVSAEVGTPERKILDTVAQALSDSQIDLAVLQGELDLNNKFGAGLDRFLSLFGFARQSATYASGFVTFSRNVPSTSAIRIPLGTQVMAPMLTGSADGEPTTGNVIFRTTFDVTLPAGDTEIVAPVQAAVSGTLGNVAANRITAFVGTPVLGITGVTNVNATSGGREAETDEELKVRFRNTVFRNLAGTLDQYLALAVSTSYSRKANVVGSISRYREYIQVPPVDDATAYDAGGTAATEAGNGNAGEYTTALSTIPYAKYIYADVPRFVSNGEVGAFTIFYREGTDWRLNTTSAARNRGDAYRLYTVDNMLHPNPATVENQPNVTFTNIYTGTAASIEAIAPGDVVLLEFSYLSSASRNDYERGVTNCVDVFVDGGNPSTATNVIHRPSTVGSLFVNDTTSTLHYENFRRIGEPEHRPVLGNVFTPLFWEPVTDLPERIVVETTTETNTFLKGIHYWPVEEITTLRGTVRARNGIEWSLGVPAQKTPDSPNGPFTGKFVTELPADTPVRIEDYHYDRNIVELQSLLEANKQVTTDVLAHKSEPRYFKLDLSVMYGPGTSITDANLEIQSLLADYFDTFNFGGVIQLSDILQVVHSASGIDNVRWTSDLPNGPDVERVYETDINGNPLRGVIINRVRQASVSRGVGEIQHIHITGSPTGGTFDVYQTGTPGTVQTLAYNVSAAAMQTALRTLTGDATLTVTGTAPYVVAYSSTTTRTLLAADPTALTGSTYVYNSDLFLRDDELPALPTGATPNDTLPGLVIRPRAQHTWTRR